MQQLIKQTIPWEIDTRLTRKFGCFKTPRWLNVQKRRRTSHDSVRGQIYYSNQSAWWFSNIGMGQNLWCSNDFLTVGDEQLSYTVYSHFDVKTAMKSAVVFGASVRGLIYIEFNPLNWRNGERKGRGMKFVPELLCTEPSCMPCRPAKESDRCNRSRQPVWGPVKSSYPLVI